MTVSDTIKIMKKNIYFKDKYKKSKKKFNNFLLAYILICLNVFSVKTFKNTCSFISIECFYLASFFINN